MNGGGGWGRHNGPFFFTVAGGIILFGIDKPVGGGGVYSFINYFHSYRGVAGKCDKGSDFRRIWIASGLFRTQT